MCKCLIIILFCSIPNCLLLAQESKVQYVKPMEKILDSEPNLTKAEIGKIVFQNSLIRFAENGNSKVLERLGEVSSTYAQPSLYFNYKRIHELLNNEE